MSLKAENLSFSYENGGRHVLTRISLKIEPGERVGLVAPSGYGKTTLCRLLAVRSLRDTKNQRQVQC